MSRRVDMVIVTVMVSAALVGVVSYLLDKGTMLIPAGLGFLVCCTLLVDRRRLRSLGG